MLKPFELRAVLVSSLLLLLPLFLAAQSANYDQPYRPQVHFSPAQHWTNDPNGLLFFRGEYHLFFQYNPFGDQWGHMSWGHAVSTDLLHWHELPVAIPEQNGIMIFTGSVVIDHLNTSGFCAHGSDCLVAIYTGHSESPQGVRQAQNLAYSLDSGRTWKQYERNPVLDLDLADFRDPSVSWDATAHHWVMAVSLPKEHKVQLYSSRDLKSWVHLSDFGPAGDIAGDWECPDLLRIPSATGKDSIWALKVGLNPGAPQGGSGEQYFLGSFDGKTFTQSQQPGSHGWTNYGKDDYCAISFNGLPATEKPILLGWMSNWQYAAKLPTSPWRGQMSLPRRLSFLIDNAGLALKQEPVLSALRGKLLAAAFDHPIHTPFELRMNFDSTAGQLFGIKLFTDEQHWTEIGFDANTSVFYIDRTHSGQQVSPEFPARTTAPLGTTRPYDLTLVVDRSSVEAYAQEGTIAMTNLIFPASSDVTPKPFPSPKAVKGSAQAWELKSIWAK